MKDNTNWFGAKHPAEAWVGLMHSFFTPLFRGPTKRPAPQNPLNRIADSGADACWTASLYRGNDLPPFLLCVHTTAESRSAVRFGPLDRSADSLAPSSDSPKSSRRNKVPSNKIAPNQKHMKAVTRKTRKRPKFSLEKKGLLGERRATECRGAKAIYKRAADCRGHTLAI